MLRSGLAVSLLLEGLPPAAPIPRAGITEAPPASSRMFKSCQILFQLVERMFSLQAAGSVQEASREGCQAI